MGTARTATRAVIALALVVLATLSSTDTQGGTAGAVASFGPPLGSLALSQSLPGYSVAPPGPTNGPLTATEFASQSSAPQQAEQQFNALATQPKFGAFIRLWTDGAGPGRGTNDMAVLLFRIPNVTDAEAFAAGLRAPFEGSASTPFLVPSLPGAAGYTVKIAAPVQAAEQIVVFRVGAYVAMTQLASSLSASNPAPLTPTQAIAASDEQYQALRHGDPSGSSDRPPPPVRPGRARPPSGSAVPIAVAALAAVVLLACAVAAVDRRRRHRRPSPAPVTGADPWEPGGLLESFGAIDPDNRDVSDPAPSLPGSDPSVPAARTVPALVAPASMGSPGAGEPSELSVRS